MEQTAELKRETNLIHRKLNKVFGGEGKVTLDLSKNEEKALLTWYAAQDTYLKASLEKDDLGIMLRNIDSDATLISNMSGDLSMFNPYNREINSLKKEVDEAIINAKQFGTDLKGKEDHITHLQGEITDLKEQVKGLQEIEELSVRNYDDLAAERNSLMKEVIRLKLATGEQLSQVQNLWLIDSLK